MGFNSSFKAPASNAVTGVTVTANQLIIVFYCYDAAMDPTGVSCTDTAAGSSNTYRKINGFSTTPGAHLFYAVAKANETVDITCTNKTSPEVIVILVDGMNTDGAAVLDTSNVSITSESASPYTGASITNGNATDYLVQFWYQNAVNGTHTENGGPVWTERTDFDGGDNAVTATYDRLVSSITSYNMSMNFTGTAAFYDNIIAAFKLFSVSALTITVNDATTASDAGTVAPTLIVSVGEVSIAVSEFVALRFPQVDLLVSDSTTVTDVIVASTGTVVLAVNDTSLVNDVIFLVSGFLVLVQANDTTTVTESVTLRLTTLFITVSDATAVTDAVTLTFAQTTITPAVFDSSPVNDVISLFAFQGIVIAVSDTIGVNTGYADISWNPNSEPDLAGYKVYQGTTTGVYTVVYTIPLASLADPTHPEYVVYNLAFGTQYFFAVTAYDTSNNESGFSSEVSKTPTDVLLGRIVIVTNIFTVFDATTVTDTPVLMMPVNIIVADGSIIVSEGFTILRPFNAMRVGDASAVTDAQTITFTTLANVSVAVSDATAATDFSQFVYNNTYNFSDATTVTDVVAVNWPIQIVAKAAGQDTTTVTDAVTVFVILSGPLATFDSTAVTEALTVVLKPILLTAFDAVVMGDGFSNFPQVGTGGRGRLTSITGTTPETVLT